MRTITFFKENQKNKKHYKDVGTIIADFHKTEESKWEMPLERLLLNFMSKTYGSFGNLTKEDWEALFKAEKEYREDQRLLKLMEESDKNKTVSEEEIFNVLSYSFNAVLKELEFDKKTELHIYCSPILEEEEKNKGKIKGNFLLGLELIKGEVEIKGLELKEKTSFPFGLMNLEVRSSFWGEIKFKLTAYLGENIIGESFLVCKRIETKKK